MERRGTRRALDLARFRNAQPDPAYFGIFQKYRGSILDGVSRALR
jgi:hypothetical protein